MSSAITDKSRALGKIIGTCPTCKAWIGYKEITIHGKNCRRCNTVIYDGSCPILDKLEIETQKNPLQEG